MASGKFTLVDMVQKILEALGSDEVNSINDSVEAIQISRLLEDSYYELLNQKEWPWLMELIRLEGLGDTDRPNFLRIPEDVVRIDNFRYDDTDRTTDPVENLNIVDVCWLDPEDFTIMVQNRNTDIDEITEYTTFNGIRLPIYNDRSPQYWTSYDDEYIVTDSFDSDLESTLQTNRTQVYAKVIPTFTREDDFVADAPSHFYQTWLADAKSAAFIYFRQEVSPKDEQRAKRGLAVLRRNASRTNQDDGKVKYGRRPV